ncbi:MAG: hypothetical protein PHT81_05325 [Endomicrobiaceae bacterium]|nr:hypothetical protein [Endomicrobiaceae bacterium]MDD3922672.1 hypothetical protein [Endomicrobiaceae bacterium]
MKRNIIILSLLCFLLLSVLMYFLIELIYINRLTKSINNAEETSISLVNIISPEIKAAFSKPDDIALLYSIERVSKIKNVIEAFILDKDLNILIHNDSSKWNKKYADNIYVNAVSSKNKLIQASKSSYNVVYSLPINENATLCAVFSLNVIYNDFKIWKIKLYVFVFILSLIITICIYYLSIFLFMRPFIKTKKYLSLNEKNKKTIYSELINMVKQDSEVINNKLDDIEHKSDKLKELLNYILKSYLQHSDDIFIVLDNTAKIIYCLDTDKMLLHKQDINTHIVNATANVDIIQNISKIIENPKSTINIDIENLKINIIPINNNINVLIGIIINGNIIK